MRFKSLSSLSLLLVLMLCHAMSHGDPINIAVAANFKATLWQLKTEFEKHSQHTLNISSASTGQLMQQIAQQAPFDIFLAADTAHPQLLWQNIHSHRNLDKSALGIYAKGRLFFFSQTPLADNESLTQILQSKRYARLSIANPKLAPYGLAAEQTLKCLNVYDQWKDKFITGQNIAQAFQFIDSQSVEAGFVAMSQVQNRDKQFLRTVDHTCYQDINQMALRLNNKKSSFEFMAFLTSPAAEKIINNNGYSLAE